MSAKGKAGLIGCAFDLKTALNEKEQLNFVEPRIGNTVAKANGVTFEGAAPAEHGVYFSIADSRRFLAPTMTLTHEGGVDIEELALAEACRVCGRVKTWMPGTSPGTNEGRR